MLALALCAWIGEVNPPELSAVSGGELGESLLIELAGTSATVPPSENLFANLQALDPPLVFPDLGELSVLPAVFLGPPNAGVHTWELPIPDLPVLLGETLHLQAFGFVVSGPSASLKFSTAVAVPLTTTGPENLAYDLGALFLKLGDPMTPLVPSFDAVLVDDWSVEPPLPSGLLLDPVSGVLSGTPGQLQSATTHTITVGNGFGEAQTTLDLAVDLLGSPTLTQTAPGFLGQPLQYELSGTVATEDVIEFLTTDSVYYEPGVLVPGLGVAFIITSSPTLMVFPGDGSHSWTVALPNEPDLVGTSVYAQASGFVLEGFSGGVRLSNVWRTLILEEP